MRLTKPMREEYLRNKTNNSYAFILQSLKVQALYKIQQKNKDKKRANAVPLFYEDFIL